MWLVALASLGLDTVGVSSMVTATPPYSPYDLTGQDEVGEDREKTPTKGDNTIKKNHATSQTNLPTQEDLGVGNQDTDKRYIAADPPSPTDLSGCLTRGPRRSMRKYVWDQLVRVKRVSFVPPLCHSV